MAVVFLKSVVVVFAAVVAVVTVASRNVALIFV